MTYPERVIGFDCREMWLPPDISDPYNILWRRDITPYYGGVTLPGGSRSCRMV